MDYLIWGGAALSLLGLAGLFWSIAKVNRARKAKLTDEALRAAVQKAEQRYKARAVKAEERREDGRRVYRIRLLSEDGRVFDVTVDAATGRME